ncbi:MAG: hypothetical protein JST06_10525 [Bacteroidetes bacterium]|nr:hypothetical protein [Bacteroidota bacterium]MBS1629775.1 hypothetical protein [Bacteroidota bacterium]
MLFISAFALSCTKTDSPSDPQTGNFNITGIHDVDLSASATGQVSLPLAVVPTGGTKDTVALSLDMLPQGVTASFSPREGITSFNSTLNLYTDYSGNGGTYSIKLRGKGHSGERSYDFKLTIPFYNGWQLGADVYRKLYVDKSSSGSYAFIRITATNYAVLRLSFPEGVALPTKNASFSISPDSLKGNMQITIYDGAGIWSATGKQTNGNSGPATGQFLIDSLQRFVFQCANVEMTDGQRKRNLNCSVGQ